MITKYFIFSAEHYVLILWPLSWYSMAQRRCHVTWRPRWSAQALLTIMWRTWTSCSSGPSSSTSTAATTTSPSTWRTSQPPPLPWRPRVHVSRSFYSFISFEDDKSTYFVNWLTKRYDYLLSFFRLCCYSENPDQHNLCTEERDLHGPASQHRVPGVQSTGVSIL